MSSKDAESCQSCRFYQNTFNEPEHGYCLRYPPKLMAMPDWDEWAESDQSDWELFWELSQSPAVESADWCGEYQPAAAADPPDVH